jgi:hypothetical protein
MAKRKITNLPAFLTKVSLSKETTIQVASVLLSQVFFLLEKSGLCVFICQKTLCDDSMKPSKLKPHFVTSDANLRNKPRDFFIRRRDEMRQQNMRLFKYTTCLNNIRVPFTPTHVYLVGSYFIIKAVIILKRHPLTAGHTY